MKYIIFLIISIYFISCSGNEISKSNNHNATADSLKLIEMIYDREIAMIDKNIDLAMDQFSDDVTWINSQGYYFVGKEEVLRFHNMLAENESLDYYYEAGAPKVRILDQNNALAYYSWKMFWFQYEEPTDTVNKEIGLMTLSAKKLDGQWKWIAITNQYTPWFYDEIEPVFID